MNKFNGIIWLFIYFSVIRPTIFSAVYTYDALSTLEYFINNGTIINRKAYTDLKEWDGVSGKITFNPDGSTSYKFYVVDTLSKEEKK